MLNLNHDCSQISIESESQNVMSFKSEFHVLCILFQAKAKDPDARPRPHYAPLLSPAMLVLIYSRSVFLKMGSRAHYPGFTN